MIQACFFRPFLVTLMFVVSVCLASAQTANLPVEQEAVPLLEVPSVEETDISPEALAILLVPMTAEDLSGLAAVWQGHLKGALEDLAQLNISLQAAEGAAAETLRSELENAVEAQRFIRDGYAAVLTAWEAKGAASEDLQPHLDYLRALSAASLRTTDAKTLLSLAADWATSWDGGLGVILQILALVVAVWVMMFVARMVQRVAKRGLSNVPSLSKLLRSFVLRSVYWFTLALGILVVLAFFGVNVTPLFAVFGGLSFILGFALQDTLGNLASGLMIMILKPFDTGA